MSVEIDIRYLGELHCSAGHGPSGATLTTDAPVDNGGRGEDFSPTDLVAAGLGSCILTVIGLVAKRSGWSLEGARARVVKHMTTSGPRRIGRLEVLVTVPTAPGLDAAALALLERAADACPVKRSLHPDVAVDVRFALAEESR
jgi:putative redox protein